MARTARRKVQVKSHTRGRGRGRVTVKSHCRRPPNRTIRPGSKRYNEMPYGGKVNDWHTERRTG